MLLFLQSAGDMALYPFFTLHMTSLGISLTDIGVLYAVTKLIMRAINSDVNATPGDTDLNPDRDTVGRLARRSYRQLSHHARRISR